MNHFPLMNMMPLMNFPLMHNFPMGMHGPFPMGLNLGPGGQGEYVRWLRLVLVSIPHDGIYLNG